ncbi:MAG: hypothetical protein ACREA3_05375 [Nitrosotalea sp.]
MRCGNTFECKGIDACWCLEGPLLREKEIKYADCVCRDCLLLQYRSRLLRT